MVTKFPFLFLPPPLPVTHSAMHFHLAIGLDDFNDSALGVCSTVVYWLHAHQRKVIYVSSLRSSGGGGGTVWL